MTTARKPAATAAKKPTNGPSEVIPGVFVGGWKDAEKFEGTRLCVLDDPEPQAPADAQFRIYDAGREAAIPANLDRVAALAHAAREKDRPVLFFCGHGVRRGPLATAWYLHAHEGLSMDEAYARIESVRPKVERPPRWIANWTPPA
jgi:hypothetical protein